MITDIHVTPEGVPVSISLAVKAAECFFVSEIVTVGIPEVIHTKKFDKLQKSLFPLLEKNNVLITLRGYAFLYRWISDVVDTLNDVFQESIYKLIKNVAGICVMLQKSPDVLVTIAEISAVKVSDVYTCKYVDERIEYIKDKFKQEGGDHE